MKHLSHCPNDFISPFTVKYSAGDMRSMKMTFDTGVPANEKAPAAFIAAGFDPEPSDDFIARTYKAGGADFVDADGTKWTCTDMF